jgi:hypothetical protein
LTSANVTLASDRNQSISRDEIIEFGSSVEDVGGGGKSPHAAQRAVLGNLGDQ